MAHCAPLHSSGSTKPPRSANRRQPLLLTMRGPLSGRFGDDFFRALPLGPGVYFFRDAAGELLYIGQSGSLRHRVGSYRHVDPDRHPRRLLRLVHRVAGIEWRECATAAEAVALESQLLLEHRPPFNRAGVWPPSVWWLRVEVDEAQRLHLELAPLPDPEAPGQWHGPLTSRQRHAFPALARCLHRVMHPQAGLWDFPVGLLQNYSLRRHSWRLPDAGAATVLQAFTDFLKQPASPFPDFLRETLTAATPVSLEESSPVPVAVPAIRHGRALDVYWEEQLEQIAALVV
ncbi:MAG: hypothetical protein JWM59_95 [Verrucomicrobiales bacterium]|nr:hypothetical protein [Verrucomicrobiales bacterium]